MEPKSSSKRSQNQLQGSPLQDQAVQFGTRQISVGPTVLPGNSAPLEKVVIQYGDKLIKGVALTQNAISFETLLRQPSVGLTHIRLRLLDSDSVEDFSILNAKAIFLVKSFDGDSQRNVLHFHNFTPVMRGLWVRVEFHDNEVMEGIVCNDKSYVLDPGFLMIPTDPGTNNKLAFILKDKLKNFEVLGTRNPPVGQDSF